MLTYRQPFREYRMKHGPEPVKTIRELRHALIVDDHPLFCDALAMNLTGSAGIAEVESAGTLEAALERLSTGALPDIILLDLNLPDVNGLDGVVRLRQAAPDTPLIVVSSLDEVRVVRAALKAGVEAFIPKYAPREAFRDAFAIIAQGDIHPSRKVLESSAPAPSDEVLRRLALLTPQQGRILQLICAGKMNKHIAYELSIAETTVKAHVTAIMRKLGVQTRMQAVLFAHEASFDMLGSDA